MPEPRFQRRKQDRPAEITEAAVAEFSEKGYTATRVDDVAKRAGVSKGLLYLYFKTKEELIKSVVRSFIEPRVDALRSEIVETDLSAEEFLRGPFLQFVRKLPHSPARVLLRLMISEGPKYPDLTAYYWNHVVSIGLDALRQLLKKSVDSGEFRTSALEQFPHLIMSPVLFSIMYSIVFDEHEALDTDRMLEAHVDLIVRSLKITQSEGSAA
jgi:AcrR family transcriptional regulator